MVLMKHRVRLIILMIQIDPDYTYMYCYMNKAIRDGKYLAPPDASAWQRSPH